MIISGGENIYPAEVENILFGHEDVAEVAVIGVPDDPWGAAVTAFVVPKPGRAIDAPALIEWSKQRLALYKAPRTVSAPDTHPRNATSRDLEAAMPHTFSKDRTRPPAGPPRDRNRTATTP